MLRTSGLFTLAVVVLSAGCASIEQARDRTARPGQAAIGIEVQVRPLLPISAYSATTVYFAREDDNGAPDLSTLYVAKDANGGRTYLVNVPPGRYMAIAGTFHAPFGRDLYVSYFPDAMVVQSAVDAEAGRLTFAGRYLVDSTAGVCPGKADPLQLLIAEAVSPRMPKCGIVAMAAYETFSKPGLRIGDSVFSLGPMTIHFGGVLRETHRDESARRAFAEGARADLGGFGWHIPSD